jgi:hypothetical protein
MDGSASSTWNMRTASLTDESDFGRGVGGCFWGEGSGLDAKWTWWW